MVLLLTITRSSAIAEGSRDARLQPNIGFTLTCGLSFGLLWKASGLEFQYACAISYHTTNISAHIIT